MVMDPSSQVAGRMARMVREVSQASPQAVSRAALAGKRVHLDEMRSASGGDLRLSGVGARGARVGVSYKLTNGQAGAAATMRATGPVHLVENPSKPHVIRPRGRRRGALSTPYGPRASVQHPGVLRPARPWLKGTQRARPVIDRTVKTVFSQAFRRGMS